MNIIKYYYSVILINIYIYLKKNSLQLSYLNSQNDITLEDITCFFLILIIQRHIKCSCNKNLFKSEVSVGQTFFLSVIQHPIATVSSKATKFWYSLVATYGRVNIHL